jgi:hypothetical protein
MKPPEPYIALEFYTSIESKLIGPYGASMYMNPPFPAEVEAS